MSNAAAIKRRKKLQALLRNLRLEAGLTQAELARLIERHQSFVSKYESGERRLDLIELEKICRALKTSLHDFVLRFEE